MTIKTDFKPGDVARYITVSRPDRHCREGMAIAEARGAGVILFDTYWQSYGDCHLLTYEELETAEVLFNLDDYNELELRQSETWRKYKTADREVVTSQHGLQKRWFVRKGAEPDLQEQLENACEAFVDAQERLRAAESAAGYAWSVLETLEAQR